MKRFDFDKTIKATTIEQASEKFCKALTERRNVLQWLADEMQESVNGGYHCCSNATLHDLKQGVVTSPTTHDWTYYWAIENCFDNTWYAWAIVKE